MRMTGPADFPEFDKEKIRTFMKELNDLSHQLDPTRKTAIRRCDFCKDIVEVYSPSIWAGWYRGIYTEYKSVTEEEFKKVKHFLHCEWGGDSHAGRHSENPDKALQALKAAVRLMSAQAMPLCLAALHALPKMGTGVNPISVTW